MITAACIRPIEGRMCVGRTWQHPGEDRPFQRHASGYVRDESAVEWGISRLERSLRASLKPDFRVQMCGGHVLLLWSGLRQRDAYTYICCCLAYSLDAQVPYVCYQRHAARLQRRAHTCITHNMHQTDLHLLGSAPPMPLLLFLALPSHNSHLFFPAVARGPTWPEGKAANCRFGYSHTHRCRQK